MQILGYSRKDFSRECDLKMVVELVGEYIDVARLSFAHDLDGGLSPFDLDEAKSQLIKEAGVGFFQEGEVTVNLTSSDHRVKEKHFPHSKFELNLYGLKDGGPLCSLLGDIGDALSFELGFILEDEAHLVSYNQHSLGVGLGLTSLTWGMYFGDGYAGLVGSAFSGKAFRFDDRRTSKVVLLTEHFDEFNSLSTYEQSGLRAAIGEDLFSEYASKAKDERGKVETRWLFSSSNLLSAVKLLRKDKLDELRKDQAKKVPSYYSLA